MIGKTISHYKILEKIGAGGMGVVYKAEDPKLKRDVALKFLPADLTRDEETRKRFIQEAQAASALEHNNICNIHEINETDDGQLYIVMAHYEGETLKDKIEHRPVELDKALDIVAKIGQGLARAHEADIIHRDIKPANIIITERDEVKILDFGLAKLGGQTKLTKMGTTLGTVAYMSPEQASGMATDRRTDIWALGVVLYEAITGQLPFKGEYDMALMYAIMNEDPQPLTQILPELPLGLEKVINKALAKEPGERYQDVNEMLDELGTAVKGKGEQPLSATTTRLEAEATSSLFMTLFERRIPQILGLYFGASFGIMQFLQLLVEQYPISPHLPQFSFVTLVSMLPTVYLLAYFHGKPGRDRWTRFEKIGIPLNLLASAVLLFFLFQDKDLGAATKTVSITDEGGNTVERTIPKSEFRKKIALFFFENVLDDSTLNWLQYGIPDLLESDLSQDLVFDIKSGFVSELKEAGFHELVGSPLTLKKKISKEKYLNYFVTGNFRKQHDTLYVTTTLYETKRSKLLAESSFKGTNIFKLVDLISVQLKRDLEIPGFHIEETEDQPLSEMLTNSIPAYRMFIASLIALVINSNEDTSLKYLEQAVEEDSTFAYAQYRLHSGYTFSSQSEKAQKALQATMQHIYKLPERVQFRVKYDYYAMKADPDKQLALSKMWTEVYPDDIEGHDFLADVYLTRNQLDEAILEYKQILELDPTQYEYLQRIGMLHRQNDQNEEALNYYKNYAEQFPTDHRSFKAIGDFYKTQGDYGPAIYYLEKALLIEPEEISVLLKLAEIKSTFGHYKQALKQYHDALKISKSPEHRMEVNRILEEFYLLRGQMGKLLEHMHLRLEDEEKMFPSLMVLISKLLFSLDKYIMAGEKDVAFQTIKDIEAQLKAPYDKLIPIGYLFIYLELEDADKAEQVLGEIEPFTQTDFYTMYGLDIPHLKAMAQGEIYELRGKYERALLSYKKADSASNFNMALEIGRCYRNLQEYKKAEKSLQATSFGNPATQYELALLYWEQNKKEQAMEHLKNALYVWAEADPAYKPAKKAGEKLAEWQD